MKKYGLIGKSLSHSFSKNYFGDKFRNENINAVYDNYEINNISEFIRIKDLDVSGFNVTTPYKKTIIPHLSRLDKRAEQIGAVNTLKRINRYWVGYNTDVIGFRKSLTNLTLAFALRECKALILGVGGASEAVQFVLSKLDCEITTVSRSNADLNYDELKERTLADYDLIVNTTPLGMYPEIESMAPLNYLQFRSGQLVYDLIYNPEKTVLLTKAEQQGAMIMNGSEMLRIQAEASWKIWNQL